MFRLIFGVLHPAYKSFKAVKTKNVKVKSMIMSVKMLKTLSIISGVCSLDDLLDCAGLCHGSGGVC